MSQQSGRQAARKAALQAQAARRRERALRDRRLESLAVEVVVALRDRDAAVAQAEQRAADGLRAMLDEGLTLREAVDWCGAELTGREATRLRRLGEQGNRAGRQ